MHFKKYNNINDFYNDTYNILMRHEAQNLIPLGNLIIGYEGKDKTDWRDPANWYMAAVSDSNGIQLTAIMTPPHNITLYATDNNINDTAIKCLIEGLADDPIPGVMAEKTLAERFANEYTAKKGISYETFMSQRIYELTKVSEDITHIGTIRLLNEKDMSFFPYWTNAFNTEIVDGIEKMNVPQDIEPYLYRVSKKYIYILEVEGIPVSMAGLQREMQTVVGVGPVYPPPYYRGKGYATSCVAKLSHIALDKGFTKCVLYTDLANPTSNSIYQKIGYRPICDSLMLKFDQTGGSNND